MGEYEEITKARRVLGLDKSASLRDIKDKYRELLRKWHPDLFRENEERRKEKRLK